MTFPPIGGRVDASDEAVPTGNVQGMADTSTALELGNGTVTVTEQRDINVASKCQIRDFLTVLFYTVLDCTLILLWHIAGNILHVYPDFYGLSAGYALHLLRRQHCVRRTIYAFSGYGR